MMKKIAALFALYASVFLIFACANYGFFWGRFDEDTVDERSPSLDNLNSKAPDLKSQTQAISTSYSFIIYTDLHYGAARKDIKEKACF